MSRKKILIPYSYNTNWIGGTYYIQNLLISLSKHKPDFDFYIYTDKKSFVDLQSKVDLPLKHIGYGFIQKVMNKIYKKVFKTQRSFVFKQFDLVFPYNLSRMQQLSDNRICWIPDLQEKHYPNFFSKEELLTRDENKKKIIETEKHLVFSSHSALSDFNQFYPNHNMNAYVLNFASFYDDSDLISESEITNKYNISEKYYICSNQFWIHKNHEVVLKAIGEFRDDGVEFIFTGKEHDHRAPDYFDNLLKLSKDLGIESRIKFLGFIDRLDQLSLMKHSLAVIQPSLFEGWSTVVEDAKSLNKQIICSDLDVHKEQLEEKGIYFNPKDHEQLVKCLNDFSQEKMDYHYEKAQMKFGSDFIQIATQVIG